jgi:peroxiredoxin (alkyl hydroperoxide reductase subunit C)
MSETGVPPSLPRLNEMAPDFTAETTQGPLTLAGLRGQWVVLFSHPADFTPVCTTELVEFARRDDEFQALGARLVGLSIDSIYAHIAWVRNMEERFGVKIPFPIIADCDARIAQLYGMIHPGASNTTTVRCVFVIDDTGLVRAMIYYPLTTGRNVGEIARLVQALQISDANGVSTPADWRPGEPLIVPAPKTVEAAERRLEEARNAEAGLDAVDWYFARKKGHDTMG